jgi:Fe-S-cluster containining protein
MENENIKFECKRCGKCCDTYSFWLGKPYDGDSTEVKKLMEYHNCTPMRSKTGELGIRIPMTCEHLGWTKDKKSYCKIHDNKPEVCKVYFCERVKQKAEIEKFVKDLGTNLNGIHL